MTYITLSLLFNSEKAIYVSRVAFTLAGAWMAIGIVPHLLSIGDIYHAAVQVDRNYQSCFLIICILQTLILLVAEWKQKSVIFRIILILTMIFDTYILLTSASRSAFIALLLGILLYCLFNFRNFKKLFGFLIIVSIAVYIAADLGLFETIFNRFTLDDVSSGNGRYDLWEKYLTGISDSNVFNFLFGHGLIGQTEFGKVAHNLFISIFYSFGFVGFILVVILVIWCAITFLKTKKTNELVVFLPIIFECMSLEPYYRMEFAIYFALVVASAIFYKNRQIERLRMAKMGGI